MYKSPLLLLAILIVMPLAAGCRDSWQNAPAPTPAAPTADTQAASAPASAPAASMPAAHP
jgi:hypothetical protein